MPSHIRLRVRLLLLLLLLATPATPSLFPGLSPNDYIPGESLNIFANNMFSPTHLPYDYFTLPFCPPSPSRALSLSSDKDSGRLGLGRILHGERARLTAYNLSLLHDSPCAHLCTARFSSHDLTLLSRRIRDNYRVRLSLDDLPVVVRQTHASYTLGYPLGLSPTSAAKSDSPDVLHLVNHLDISVMYHIADSYESLTSVRSKPYRIVGFEVHPRSLQTLCQTGRSPNDSAPPFVLPTSPQNDISIPFSYSLRFVESNVPWATRYDTLLKVSSTRNRMHVFAIVNSLMLALFLSASLAVILFRTLRRDCARYYGSKSAHAASLLDDFHDDLDLDVGWRTLRGDVFRPPRYAGLLAVLCGSGAQLALVSALTLSVALLGIVSPHRRGSLVTGLLLLWVVSSGLGGFVAARLHKAMGGVQWRLVTVGVAVVLPGIAFGTFLIANLFLWALGSIGAAPLLTLFGMLCAWLGVSVPLAFVGTYAGYRRKAYDFPVRTNQIPRPIPRQPAYLETPAVHLLSGMVPFGVVCLELRVILNSIYMEEFYHFFGFLVAVVIILAVTCAEVSVVVVFVKLSNCDYSWWWNSWLASAMSGLYVLAFSVYYLVTSPGVEDKNVAGMLLFMAYSFVGSMCFALVTGVIGFVSSLVFVRRIYSDTAED